MSEISFQASGQIITFPLSYTAHYVCYIKAVYCHVTEVHKLANINCFTDLVQVCVQDQFIPNFQPRGLQHCHPTTTKLMVSIASYYTVLDIPNIWVPTHALHKAVLQAMRD